MAFVTPFELLSTLALLAGMCGLVSILSSVLKIHPLPLTFEDSRREISNALLLGLLVFIATTAMEAIRFIIYRPLLRLDERPPLTVDYYDVGFTVLFYLPWGILLLLILRRTRQDCTSVGVINANWKRVLLFGFLLGLFYFGIVGLFGAPLSSSYRADVPSLGFGLVNNAIIGFSEELIWRGYIQTRLSAYLGPSRGLISTSILFAMLHFPQRFFLYSGVVLEAISSTLLVTAAGLLFGFIMMKSQSVLAPGVFHTVANWTGLFWGIGSF